MARPDPIQYAERLYGAICAANFSPISFLAFGNAVKEGIAMRNIPRIAAEPFMRVVGEMLDLEEAAEETEIVEAAVVTEPFAGASDVPRTATEAMEASEPQTSTVPLAPEPVASPTTTDKRRSKR
jgi:hypothetical protein